MSKKHKPFSHMLKMKLTLFFIASVMLLMMDVSMMSVAPFISLTVFKLRMMAIEISLKCTMIRSNFNFSRCYHLCTPPFSCAVKPLSEEH